MSANKYRGEIVLDLPMGAVTTLVNSNALRMMMEEMEIEDINAALLRIDKNPIDMIPRLCWHGMTNWNLLHGKDSKVPPWDSFAAQIATIDVLGLFEKIAAALSLDDKKKQETGETNVSP